MIEGQFTTSWLARVKMLFRYLNSLVSTIQQQIQRRKIYEKKAFNSP